MINTEKLNQSPNFFAILEGAIEMARMDALWGGNTLQQHRLKLALDLALGKDSPRVSPAVATAAAKALDLTAVREDLNKFRQIKSLNTNASIVYALNNGLIPAEVVSFLEQDADIIVGVKAAGKFTTLQALADSLTTYEQLPLSHRRTEQDRSENPKQAAA